MAVSGSPVIDTKKLDSHLRQIIQRHFHPEQGSRYWVEKAKELGIDPFQDITSYQDLNKFGLLNDDDLRRIPVEDFVPRSALDFKLHSPHIYETGGSSGVPKRVIDVTHQEENARWVAEILKDHGFNEKGNWLNLFPSGPHAVSLFTYSIAKARHELCYFVDLDPRWVKICVKEKRTEVLERYIEHIMEQSLAVLNTQEIKYLFITPKLLESLIRKVDLSKKNIKGILCGGTQITRDFYRFLKTELLPDVHFCALYGNTLMGVAPQVPAQFMNKESPSWSIQYYGYFPNFIIEVVDKNNPSRLVPYGERGRVKIVVLNDDVFIPGLLERDEGTRIQPNERFPWDGIADVGIFESIESSVIEGVY